MVTASIDFGTTNSVATLNVNGKIIPVKLGRDNTYTPTVLFFNFDDKKFYIGDEAIEQLEDGELGRYFVSLKTFLGSKDEIEINLAYKRYKIEDLIAVILKRFKNKIDKMANCDVKKLTLGRPVRFNDSDDRLDKLAQDRLKRAALKAGFKEINFCFEPIAAALSYKQNLSKDETILVADIGGGTTDYTIINLKSNKILSTYGIYIGGNNFDSKIIREFISPYLGEGIKYKNMGKDMHISHSLYVDLYEYYRFIKMYDKQIIDSIKKYIQMAYDKTAIKRLLELIEDGEYFNFINAIVDAKVSLSKNSNCLINMNFFEEPFSVKITQKEFNTITEEEIAKIKDALYKSLEIANISPKKIDKVFLTGGTTLIPAVAEIYKEVFNSEKLIQTNVFSSVGYGLALCNNMS